MMRIAYLNKVKMDEALPAVNFTFFNALGLAQAGAETHLFVQANHPDFSCGDVQSLFGMDSPPLLNWHILPVQKKWGIRSNQWFYRDVIKHLRRMHNTTPLDAVISRDPGALPYLARLRSRLGIPVFYQPHNFYVDLSLRPDLNPRNARKYHLLEKRYIGRLSGLLCLQESQAELYRRYFPTLPVMASPPGFVRFEDYDPGRFRRRLLGYSGSLQLKKGVKVLIDALDILQNDGGDYQVILIGGRNQTEIKEIESYIIAKGLESRVEITGWISFKEVNTLLKKISVGVMPLTDIFYNRYLTAPNKLFDYLSHTTPVIGSDLPSIRDFIKNGHEGILVEAENGKALAAAITEIFADEMKYKQFVDACRQTGEKYLWKERGRAMLNLIRES